MKLHSNPQTPSQAQTQMTSGTNPVTLFARPSSCFRIHAPHVTASDARPPPPRRRLSLGGPPAPALSLPAASVAGRVRRPHASPSSDRPSSDRPVAGLGRWQNLFHRTVERSRPRSSRARRQDPATPFFQATSDAASDALSALHPIHDPAKISPESPLVRNSYSVSWRG